MPFVIVDNETIEFFLDSIELIYLSTEFEIGVRKKIVVFFKVEKEIAVSTFLSTIRIE